MRGRVAHFILRLPRPGRGYHHRRDSRSTAAAAAALPVAATAVLPVVAPHGQSLGVRGPGINNSHRIRDACVEPATRTLLPRNNDARSMAVRAKSAGLSIRQRLWFSRRAGGSAWKTVRTTAHTLRAPEPDDASWWNRSRSVCCWSSWRWRLAVAGQPNGTDSHRGSPVLVNIPVFTRS